MVYLMISKLLLTPIGYLVMVLKLHIGGVMGAFVYDCTVAKLNK